MWKINERLSPALPPWDINWTSKQKRELIVKQEGYYWRGSAMLRYSILFVTFLFMFKILRMELLLPMFMTSFLCTSFQVFLQNWIKFLLIFLRSCVSRADMTEADFKLYILGTKLWKPPLSNIWCNLLTFKLYCW